MIGLARLGRDAELRTTQSGEKVASLSLAFNHGQKGADGNRPTQWVDGSLWGKRAEALIDYLVKGQQVVVTIDDPHIEEFQGRNGPGVKLAGRVTQIELAGKRDDAGGQQRAAAPAPAAARPPAPASAPRPAPAPASSGFADDDDSEIPF
jgi:single-strand DNA-binding protein